MPTNSIASTYTIVGTRTSSTSLSRSHDTKRKIAGLRSIRSPTGTDLVVINHHHHTDEEDDDRCDRIDIAVRETFATRSAHFFLIHSDSRQRQIVEIISWRRIRLRSSTWCGTPRPFPGTW